MFVRTFCFFRMAHCTATPKYPSTKSQTFGSCPYTLKKLYSKIPLCSPRVLASCRGNSWGYQQAFTQRSLYTEKFLLNEAFPQNLLLLPLLLDSLQLLVPVPLTIALQSSTGTSHKPHTVLYRSTGTHLVVVH